MLILLAIKKALDVVKIKWSLVVSATWQIFKLLSTNKKQSSRDCVTNYSVESDIFG